MAIYEGELILKKLTGWIQKRGPRFWASTASKIMKQQLADMSAKVQKL